mmetsp:Transcript_21361/g.46701  ORF Transcript_21361/g.46701 Transcript_21361/m.46701 type:complete len:372 (+) Transcript_21361:177-1292(+)|eukprot:CAMPEP_0202893440 /NCGR_PEP_ID=MMETSP1392-20130828/3027_1 /ASSEMBLY_ACC=CAM_ASM_000868 /TAXON_ID=225041 /ORGANISM="Chlamydomonas chlamydogama, Strain SAG 11-48b" /LENGTH=371 /DNA_ID=CAMNT_0049577775 /DNA_START=166 /DNA_END=1281 /DNA_ORIENTATION=-
MGCGASTHAPEDSQPRSVPVAEDAANKRAAENTVGSAVTSGNKAEPIVVREEISKLANEEPDSPTTVRVTDRKKPTAVSAENIPTVFSDDEATPRNTEVANPDSRVRGSQAVAQLLEKEGSQEVDSREGSKGRLSRHESTKLPVPEAVVLGASQSLGNSGRIDAVAPPPASSAQAPKKNGWGDDERVTIRSVAEPASSSSNNRYEDLTYSDDEDEDGRFDLLRWQRFYKWNKNKHADLLDFLWKRFDSKQYSMFCATYKGQDQIFAAFQGQNVTHGMACRLEACQLDLFSIMHTLLDFETNEYKVVGVFIFRGTEVPPPVVSLPDYELFQWLKAEPKDPLVRQFVSSLIVGNSPVPQYNVVASCLIQLQAQ